jgi:hypothetical protein
MSDDRADLIPNTLRAIRSEQAGQRQKLDEIISPLGALSARSHRGVHELPKSRSTLQICRCDSTMSIAGSRGSNSDWTAPKRRANGFPSASARVNPCYALSLSPSDDARCSTSLPTPTDIVWSGYLSGSQRR